MNASWQTPPWNYTLAWQTGPMVLEPSLVDAIERVNDMHAVAPLTRVRCNRLGPTEHRIRITPVDATKLWTQRVDSTNPEPIVENTVQGWWTSDEMGLARAIRIALTVLIQTYGLDDFDAQVMP